MIGSENGYAPSRRQAIIWTNAGILLTNFSEILIENWTYSFQESGNEKVVRKLAAILSQPQYVNT